VAAQAVEVAGRELDRGWPEDTLAFVLLEPELEGVDYLRVDLKSPVFREINSQANQRSREAGELVFEAADFLAVGVCSLDPVKAE
jgi:hypothetical protein